MASCVYTPPDYDTNPKAKYPVLYLLHGWGEDEQARSGPRRRHRGQPDRREEGQAHDHRHGQPQCRETGGERSLYPLGDRSRKPPEPPPPAGTAPGGRAGPRPRRARVVGQFGFHRNAADRSAPDGRADLQGGARPRTARWPGCPWVARKRSARPWRISTSSPTSAASAGVGGRGGFDPKTSSDGVFADAAAFNKVKVLFLGIGGRAGNEDVQRTTHASRHQEYLLRVARHRARVADVAPLLQRVCSASVSLSSLILHPRCSNEPLPVRERTVWPPESNSRRAFCHRLDEGELAFRRRSRQGRADRWATPTVPAVEEFRMHGTGRSPWLPMST